MHKDFAMRCKVGTMALYLEKVMVSFIVKAKAHLRQGAVTSKVV